MWILKSDRSKFWSWSFQLLIVKSRHNSDPLFGDSSIIISKRETAKYIDIGKKFNVCVLNQHRIQLNRKPNRITYLSPGIRVQDFSSIFHTLCNQVQVNNIIVEMRIPSTWKKNACSLSNYLRSITENFLFYQRI